MGTVILKNFISDKLESHLTGYLTDLVISWNDGKTLLLLINLYNPTGQQKAQLTIHSQLHQLLGELLGHLAIKYPNSHIEIVVGGDFNNILEIPKSKKNKKILKHLKKLNDFIECFNLKDAFYLLLSKGLPSTNRASNGKNRRLDRFYISEGLLENTALSQTNTLGTISTHDEISIKFALSFNLVQLGPKRFKLHNQLIPFIANSKKLSQLPSISHLIAEIRLLAPLTKTALNSLQRSDPSILPDPYERLNSVFKQNPNTNPIDAFVIAGDRKLTDIQDLLAHATSYYKDIFSAKDYHDPNAIRQYLLTTISSRKLMAHEDIQLDNPIIELQIKAAIWQANWKSEPGPDGITYILHKESWEIIKHHLLKE